MQGMTRVMTGVAIVVLVGGCRTATRMIEEPRVDLEMPESANRGFLVGTPPPAAEGRKTTRQMVETEIEIPPLVKTAPPSDEPTGETSGDGSTEPSTGTTTYTK